MLARSRSLDEPPAVIVFRIVTSRSSPLDASCELSMPVGLHAGRALRPPCCRIRCRTRGVRASRHACCDPST